MFFVGTDERPQKYKEIDDDAPTPSSSCSHTNPWERGNVPSGTKDFPDTQHSAPVFVMLSAEAETLENATGRHSLNPDDGDDAKRAIALPSINYIFLPINQPGLEEATFQQVRLTA